jgi:hypothetical protein
MVAGAIRDALRGVAGDQLALGLEDRVGQAIRGIENAAGHFGPNDSLQGVVDRGDDAVVAWREAARHGALLDQVQTSVVRELAYMDDLIPPDLKKDQGPMVLASFWVGLDRASADTLSEVGRLFFEVASSGVPAARWLKIYKAANGLRLNSVSQAIQVLQQVKDAEDEDHQLRYSYAAQRQRAVDMMEDDEVEAPGDVGFEEVS